MTVMHKALIGGWLAAALFGSTAFAATPTKPVKAAAPAQKVTPLAPGAEQMISHGRFDDIAMYTPKRQIKSFVMLLSGAKGWTAADAETAHQLTERGALVAGIDTARLYAGFEKADDKCLVANGDFENLSRYLQAYYKVPGYFPPILVGEGTGAALAYMLVAQADEGTFTGAISLGFCPQTQLRKAMCKGENLRYAKPGLLKPAKELGAPWTWIDVGPHHTPGSCSVKIDEDFPDVDNGRRISSAASNRDRLLEQSYEGLVEKLVPAQPPPLLGDLPLIELPIPGGSGDLFAILISGDGGWAGID